jgi:hypothetical protein
MNRGDHAERIFCDDPDREPSLSSLAAACRETGGRVHALLRSYAGKGVGEQPLEPWRKGHQIKVRLALRLRAEPTVTSDWIARRQSMGTRGPLAHLPQRKQRAELAAASPERLLLETRHYH